MSLQFAAISPHPPIIVPSVGNKEDLTRVADTTDAMRKLAEDFESKEVETVIVITPHGSVSKKTFNIYSADRFTSSLPGALLSFDGNPGLVDEITELKYTKKIEEATLDHGSAVPLYFLKQKKPSLKAVPITFSMKSRKIHFNFGKKLFDIIEKSEEKIGIIASGDLSHKLTPSAPAGFSEKGKKFDQDLMEFLRNNEIEKIVNMDQNLIDEAGQCGYRSILILLGLLSKTNCNPEVLSYEGPFGVGYGVVNYNFENEN
ncbi:MAG: AmmeMemoRadiSam system protein B [Patescibacteria group bacterium]